MFTGTLWAIVPPLVAILLALLTKQVYLSLFTGCFLGALFITGFNIWDTFATIFSTMAENMDINILIFDVFLGMIIVLLGKSGGTAAYGEWASKKIKSKRGALLSTTALGVLIFVDDYFNCLTVGNVMRPVTDRYKVSRAKLAYVIDATAAPICILAPVSSWAAAVSSYIPDGYGNINGFTMFLQAIPFNFYAILTLVMVVMTSFFLFDFGKMKIHEDNAAKGDLFTTGSDEFKDAAALEEEGNPNGRVFDLILPVVVLIVTAICAMIYTGFDSGATDVVTAFANCDASYSLVFATTITVIFMALLYLPRKIVTFDTFCNSIADGFKIMVPAITVLILAWTLKGITSTLDIASFVQSVFSQNSFAAGFMPLLMFVIAIFLGFSTGTSWGTMGILVPIAIPMFSNDYSMMVICVSSIMAGAVCGDHISPISDTTIMSSTGAQSNHINHVQTQMQYAAVVISVSAASYVIAGFTKSPVISLVFGIVALVLMIYVLMKKANHSAKDVKVAVK